MKLETLLTKIAPLPFYVSKGGDVVWSTGSVTPCGDSNTLGRVCDAAHRWALHDKTHAETIRLGLVYVTHASNVLPELLEAARAFRNRTTTDGAELFRLDAALAAAEEVKDA